MKQQCPPWRVLLLMVGAIEGHQLWRQREQKWDYEDQGSSWYSTFANCGDSTHAGQSPINCSSANAVLGGSARLFYQFAPYQSPVTMSYDGHVLVAQDFPDDVGTISVGNSFPSELQATYKLKRIAVHTPSEHTFRDPSGIVSKMPLELQLFHEGGLEDGAGHNVAAVAVGFYQNATGSNSFLNALHQGGLPQHAGLDTKVNRELPAILDFSNVFGPLDGNTASQVTFWQYDGSLTTPPCDPGVTWFVRDDAVLASEDSIKQFRDVVSASTGLEAADLGNARQLQPVAGRQVAQIFSENVAQSSKIAPPDNGFRAAVKTAERAQEVAREALGAALNVTETASGAQAQAGEETLEQGSHQEICGKNLARTEEELIIAKTRYRAKCAVAAYAQVAVANAPVAEDTDSPQQAAATRNAHAALCTTLTKNVQGLTKSADAQREECDRLNGNR